MLQPSIGTVIFGRYMLRRELARGGMGSVWEAEDRKLKRPVAIKMLYALWAESQEALTRFEREAMAVARLQSPHVVQIFDYGVERECPFIVMELLAGEDLRQRIKRGGRLSMMQTATIVVQAAKALSSAHAAGIVHRDLKPGNVFLVRGREEEMVKILDFGVAKARLSEDIDQETTKEGAILGTPRYMSPEQALQSRTVDFRTDLWSLAVIAFRALTGTVPFAGKSPADIIVKLCTQKPPRASSVMAELGPEIDDFFDRALQRRPEDRFQSATELATAFALAAEASFPSLDMPTPTAAIVAATQQAKIGMVRSVPRAIMATLPGVGPGPAVDEDDEDEAPTIGLEGLTLESLEDDADTAKVVGT
ncbi:MAG: serine/threonine protein kinase, partial [Deltaproteobacteria bacterium]|nr:serine/threonine protein kinase [Deltaproteobacteria bacterium]MBW2536266.1 serine/threonine protein kinase [Deltaproteobacteria bacterium]